MKNLKASSHFTVDHNSTQIANMVNEVLFNKSTCTPLTGEQNIRVLKRNRQNLGKSHYLGFERLYFPRLKQNLKYVQLKIACKDKVKRIKE